MENKILKKSQKLSQVDRLEIVRMHDENYPITAIAEKFNVSRPTVYATVNSMLEKELEKQNNGLFKKQLMDLKIKRKAEVASKKSKENQGEQSDEEDDTISSSTKREDKDESEVEFMGIKLSKDGPSDPRIKKALDKTLKLLDITQFIKVTKFELNKVMFDYFWQVIIGCGSAHVRTAVLEWFGYEGDVKLQKRNFISMLKRNNIEFEELTYDSEEIELYPTIKEELSLLPNDGARISSKFLIMKPDDIKCAMMNLKTKNGDSIRRYYVSLEHLFKLYVEYTLYFNHRESQRKITSLEVMMADMKLEHQQTMLRQEQYMRSLGISLEEVKDQNEELLDETRGLKKLNKGLKFDVTDVKRKLGIAVEDRAPLPLDKSKQERFVLIKRNDPEVYDYYAIRAQDAYTTKKLKAFRTLFPDLEILLDFKCNPNSKTLYVRIKDILKAKGVSIDGNNIDLDGSDVTQQELIEEMRSINDSKRDL